MKKKLILNSLFLLILFCSHTVQGQNQKAKKIIVIGIDGMIYSALGYASTPGIDRLLQEGSYSKNGFSGLPSQFTTGWSTILTGVSAQKHLVYNSNTFAGNNFDKYPSIVERIKQLIPTYRIASIVREQEINNYLNSRADIKENYSSDAQVFDKTIELLGGNNADIIFTQLSSPREVGNRSGYQLRESEYVLTIQQVDNYIEKITNAIRSRQTYSEENWAIYVMSTHGGTETGQQLNSTLEEVHVPIILSGSGIDKKELLSTTMQAKENGNNYLQINKSTNGEKTYARVPLANSALKGMNKFTLEMWIKSGTNSSDPAIVGDKDWDSGGNPGFVVCRSGSSWKINIANDKRARYDINSSKPIEDGKWHHLAISFDKTKECIIYQDGIRVGQANLTYKADDSMASPLAYLSFAQDGTGSYGGGSPNWAGSFNEVRIWTEPLTESTIKKYMYVENIEHSDHPALQNLNLYMKMDETRGGVIKDYSGKGNDAELIGSATERHPYYPVSLADVAVNIFSHLGLQANSSWGLEGNILKANVPFRLFKVN